MRQITVRLKEGDGLREEIERLVKENNVKAGIVASLVGSLWKAVLRMPVVDHNPVLKTWDEPLEIVSATGTLSALNGCHIHISVSDVKGNTFGGHLSKGSIVRSTAEVVILVFDDVEYKRVFDPQTGYEELEAE